MNKVCKHDNILISDSIFSQLYGGICVDCGKQTHDKKSIKAVRKAIEKKDSSGRIK